MAKEKQRAVGCSECAALFTTALGVGDRGGCGLKVLLQPNSKFPNKLAAAQITCPCDEMLWLGKCFRAGQQKRPQTKK